MAAICGRNRDRAHAIAARHEIPHVYADYRELIDKGNLHALIVATPDDLHYPIVMSALDAGLHVLCEKPLANTSGQAWSMYEKAEAVGVKHMVLFTWRWTAHFQFLHKLIADGYIGHCFHVQFSFLASYGRAAQYGWRFDRRRANGILGDLGSHMIDFARWYVGDVRKVSANLASFIERPGADSGTPDPANDSAILALEFANGAHGTIHVSAVAHTADRWVEQHLSFHGEAGTLHADVLFGGTEASAVIRGARRGEDHFQTLAAHEEPVVNVESSRVGLGQGTTALLRPSVVPALFIDAIVEDRPILPNFHDGFKVQQVIDAALESHRTGCRIAL